MLITHYKFGFLQLAFATLLVFNMHAVAGDITTTVYDTSGKPLENAIVYAEPAIKTSTSAPAPVAISQKGRRFWPLVSVVQTGSNISFPNNDTVRHHVYSFSPAKTFEIKLYAGVPTNPIAFDKPGTVVLGCNIHDQMIGYIQVVDTPYFGKTDESGKVKLADIPNGQYQLKTWHYAVKKENYTDVQTITVKGSEQATVKLDIDTGVIVPSK